MRAKSIALLLAVCFCWNGLAFQPHVGSVRLSHSRRKLTFQSALLAQGSGSQGEPSDLVKRTRLENLTKNAKQLLASRNDPEKIASARTQVLSGATVSLAMIPEAVGFSFVAGVNPIVGLWSAVVMGFFAAAFGGRPGIITGASGACAVVVTSLVAAHGPVYLSACVLLAGVLQMLAGLGGLGKWIRLVPHPVMLGFVNGLAIVMTKAQLTHFSDPVTGTFLKGAKGATMFGLTAASMIFMKALPRLTKAIPASLGTIVLVTAISKGFNLPAKTLIDIAGAETFRGGLSILPSLSIPAIPFTLKSLGIIFPYALTMATVGLIESLLTLQLVDGMVEDGRRGSTSKECRGQGLGNFFSGLTGGMGGCALIGQSLMNVESGGSKRLAGISMSLALGTGIVAAAPLLGQIPIAALVGIMLLVCQQTFNWSSLRLFGKIPKLDTAIIVLVSWITVVEDLAQAVVAGTIMSALSFAWKQSTQIFASPSINDKGWKEFKLSGPLFFGSTQKFDRLFDIKSIEEKDVVLDFMESRVYDHSALVAINDLSDKFGEAGKTVHLRHLSPDCQVLLGKVHKGEGTPPYELVESDGLLDPVYEPVEESGLYGGYTSNIL
ncbi:hypothetical protein TrVE_jg11089 [Triparma verrucosa]|uniref:STAS domain-containing protein n=1 Tax=Triparma verrucosa TaxID=1606542 RepID=A0A9W7C6T3_9STRA|nr:hypothetical protein TrVE_jg11089 [Triparma verrucosa]